MKNIILLFVIIITINTITFSQSCLPEGIDFNTQAEIDNFQINYPNCTEIEGYVRIQGNNITNLNGLINLVSIGGQLDISYSNNLNNLEGLNNLTSLGRSISIWNNNSLTSISALSNTAFSDSGNYQFVEIIDNDALINLEGLNSIDTITDHLSIESNEALTSLTGLQNLKFVSGYFQLDQNDALTNLEGLNNLNCVNYIFNITRNDALTNLEGLNNLTTLNGGFVIQFNDSLLSLSGLNSLIITDHIWIENNPMLTDITALTNVESNSIESLVIKSNPSLMNCDIESICNYLMMPISNVVIYNNSTGCNSEEEVIAACTESISEINHKSVFIIYPNPATNFFLISSNNELVNAVTIYNQLGQKVIIKTKPINKIDISMLKQGIYVIEIASHKLKIWDKLIIQ